MQILFQVTLAEIIGPTCQTGNSFFEHSLACGACPSNTHYNKVMKRCACNATFSESPTAATLTCTNCGNQRSIPGQTSCYTVLGESDTVNLVHPCTNGSDVLVQGTNIICAPVGYINHNPFKAQDKIDAQNPCPTGTVFSDIFRTCFVNGTSTLTAAEAAQHEAMQVCKSGRSAAACASLHNYCVLNATFCAIYDQAVQTLGNDTRMPTNVSLQDEIKQIRGYNFFIQVTNLQGQILYNGPFSESFLSLCSYAKSIGTSEFWEMSMNNLSQNKPTRQQQFGFAQRLSAEDTVYQLGLSKAAMTQPFTNNLASGYYEYCDAFVNQVVYAFQNQTLFFSMYVNNLETIRVPVVEMARGVPDRIRPADFADFNGSTKFVLAHFDENASSLKFATKIKLDFAMNNSFRYSPVIRVQYATLQRQQFSFPQVKDQSPLTQYLPRLFPTASKKKIAFDLEVRNFGSASPSLPLTGIVALVIVTFCGLIIGFVQNCRGSGTGGISFNPIKLPKIKRNKAGELEETTKSGVSHILDIFWYIFNYLGMGLNLYCAIYQLQFIFVREETMVTGIPDNLFIINLVGFFLQLAGYINSKVDDANKSVLFIDAQPSRSDIGYTVDTTIKSGWRVTAACNALLKLQQMHLGELQLTSVTFLILQAAFDFFYNATPSIQVDSVFSIDKMYLCLSTAGIYSLIYLAIVVAKSIIYWFSHSPFSSFQELLQSINLSMFMFDTPRSCVYVHGGVKEQEELDVNQGDMIDYCQQVFTTKSIGRQIAESEAQVLRIFCTNNEEQDKVCELSQLIESHVQKVQLQIKKGKITEKKIYGIERYQKYVVENHYNMLNVAAEVQDKINTLGKVETIGFEPWLIYDIPRGMDGTEPRYFKYEKVFNSQSIIYRNPKYKNQFWYEEWIQELSFLNSFIMLLSYWIYNQYLCIIIITFFLVVLDWLALWKFKKTLGAANLVQPNFLGYF